MNSLGKRNVIAAIAFAVAAPAVGAATGQPGYNAVQEGNGVSRSQAPSGDRDEARDASQEVNKATDVINTMRADRDAGQLLRHAKGVFIVPTYGRVALGVGGRGGSGVLLVKHGDRWSDPVFYGFGGASAGVQAGIEGGSFVLVLNNDRAVNSFLQNNNWSLNAGAGLTIVDWSAKGQVSTGKGDITMWSNTKGLFGGATVSITDIHFASDETAAYYGRQATAQDVVTGSVTGAQARSLQSALAQG